MTLIDASLWIDFTRSKSPPNLKQFVTPHILDSSAHLAEPVWFEVLRYATDQETRKLTHLFENYPILSTPTDLWLQAANLGRSCRQAGHTAGPLDLLIASVALAHQALLITFDQDFEKIATVSSLRVKLLKRP